MERLCAMLVRGSQSFALRGLLVVLAGAGGAQAQPRNFAPSQEESRDSAVTPGLVPGAVAVVPGVLVHGAGHYAAGAPDTGRFLLKTEAIGLGGVLVPGALLAVTGASRRFVGVLTTAVVSGFGLFAISALADIYGASGIKGGDPVTVAPILETQIGGVYAYDPIFQYRFFLEQGVQARLGAWKLGGANLSALDDTNGRISLSGGYRWWGPGPSGKARDGSFLDLDLGLYRHHYGTEHFVLWTGDVRLQGRLDLGRFGATLRGSFAELGIGWALQSTQYRVRYAVADYNELLLPRFAFGWYLGRPGETNGEVSLGYDHRHDGLAAGLKIRGLGSGAAGHFEARGRVFRGRWGLGASAQVGSAYVLGLSLIFRQGGPF